MTDFRTRKKDGQVFPIEGRKTYRTEYEKEYYEHRKYTPLEWEKSGDITQTKDHTIAKGNYENLRQRYYFPMSRLDKVDRKEIIIEPNEIKDMPIHSVVKAPMSSVVKIHNSYFNKKLVYGTLEDKEKVKIINSNGTINKNEVGKKYPIYVRYNSKVDDMFPVAIKGNGDNYYLIAPVNPDNIQGNADNQIK